MPYVGSEGEAEVSLGDVIADILCAVVGDREGFDGEACDLEGGVDSDVTTGGSYGILDEATLGNAIMH